MAGLLGTLVEIVTSSEPHASTPLARYSELNATQLFTYCRKITKCCRILMNVVHLRSLTIYFKNFFPECNLVDIEF
jgi:hypothetical protein